jgi:hypothetical protein
MRNRINVALYIISLFTTLLSILAYFMHNEADAIYFLVLAVLARVWVIEGRMNNSEGDKNIC